MFCVMLLFSVSCWCGLCFVVFCIVLCFASCFVVYWVFFVFSLLCFGVCCVLCLCSVFLCVFCFAVFGVVCFVVILDYLSFLWLQQTHLNLTLSPRGCQVCPSPGVGLSDTPMLLYISRTYLEIELTCKKLGKHIKNWARFQNFKILQNWDFATPWRTKIA